MKKKFISFFLIITVLGFIWTTVLFVSVEKQLSRSLGIRIPANSTLISTDSHGGFNGDGDLMGSVWSSKEKKLRI
ncbi:hypothetical protein [Carnobacterium iners]|uniref:hypothetical protein n=1 Tax=Carnobacterium iners TaxID=1073423 RepID=UPI0008B983E3|nr:hypothetical protein [Carnobacterium iners]SEK51798.1 hypothetical protein SAMN04488114_10553 [Carnobacterium iners]